MRGVYGYVLNWSHMRDMFVLSLEECVGMYAWLSLVSIIEKIATGDVEAPASP